MKRLQKFKLFVEWLGLKNSFKKSMKLSYFEKEND